MLVTPLIRKLIDVTNKNATTSIDSENAVFIGFENRNIPSGSKTNKPITIDAIQPYVNGAIEPKNRYIGTLGKLTATNPMTITYA